MPTAPMAVNAMPVMPVMLKESDAARLLGVRHVTLKRWRLIGQGPAFVRTPSGTVRYRLSDIATFIDEAAARAASE